MNLKFSDQLLGVVKPINGCNQLVPARAAGDLFPHFILGPGLDLGRDEIRSIPSKAEIKFLGRQRKATFRLDRTVD